MIGMTKRSLDGSTVGFGPGPGAKIMPVMRSDSGLTAGGSAGVSGSIGGGGGGGGGGMSASGSISKSLDVAGGGGLPSSATGGSLTRSGRRHHSISIMNTSQKDPLPSSSARASVRHGSGSLVTAIEAFNTALENNRNHNLTEESAENSDDDDDDDEDHDTHDIYGNTPPLHAQYIYHRCSD